MAKQTQSQHLSSASEPVYFMDLVVENVKCFKDRQTMDLSDGNGRPAKWTIILGDNGTGKTTLLKCLVGMFPRKYKFDDANGNPVQNDVGPNFNRLDDILRFRSFPEGVEAVLKINKFASGGFKTQIFEHIYGGEFYLDKKMRRTGKKHYFYNKNLENKSNLCYAYGASRRMGKGSLTETKNADPHATLFDDNATLINAEAWLLETDFAIKNAKGETKKYLQKQYVKIKDTLKKLLPDVQDFRIKAITKSQTQAAMEVQTPYGWVAMKDLSLGYQTIIAWIVDLAARMFERYPDSDNPLAEPAIVLVDEIDLHMHPKWQRRLIDFLDEIFVETQFIVTAHSPLIVQAAENANLVLLKREGESVQIHNDVESDIIWKWRVDQLLTSDLFDLQTARPPKYEKLMQEQQDILDKPSLKPSDKKRLEEIGAQLDEMPPGEQVSEAIEALQKAAEIFKGND